jgi:hypothetical protein
MSIGDARGVGGSTPDDHPFPLSLSLNLTAVAKASEGTKLVLATTHDLQVEVKALHLRSALLLMPAPVGPATPSARSKQTLPVHLLSASELPPTPAATSSSSRNLCSPSHP